MNILEGTYTVDSETAHSGRDIEFAIQRIAQAASLGSLSTTGITGISSCTVYFAADSLITNLWILSELTTEHSRNIATFPDVAVNVFLPTLAWGDPIAGLQLRGTCEVEASFECIGKHYYLKRFPSANQYLKNGFVGDFSNSRFHKIVVRSIKVVDMLTLGEEEYIQLSRS